MLRASCVLLAALSILGYGARASADILFLPFGPFGRGGNANGHQLRFGAGCTDVDDDFDICHGNLWQLDSFFNIDGQDLNDSEEGTAALVGFDNLPPGVDFHFAASLSGNASDLTLTYTWTNNTGEPLNGVTVLSYIDMDIKSFGDDRVAVVGNPGPSENFEVDVPGSQSEIRSHLRAAALDGVNEGSVATNISMAMSFQLSSIENGQSATMQVMLSEDSDTLADASFHLVQSDVGPFPPPSSETLTVSGVADPMPAQVSTFSLDPFPASGRGGSDNGQTFDFGQDSEVFQLESFFDVAGQDLNGDQFDGTAVLVGGSVGLPQDVGFDFTSQLSSDGTDLTLVYTFTNNTGDTLNDVTVLSFVDADIGASFSDDLAAVVGSPQAGESFEVDERGTGDLESNLALAALDGTNTATVPSDALMSIAREFASIQNGQSATVQVELSTDGDFLGDASFHLVQSDSGSSNDTLTYSATAVPEPGQTALLVAALLGLSALARTRTRRSPSMERGQ